MARKKEQEETFRGAFVVTSDRPLTPEQAVMGVFGMSFDCLVREIIENRGGRYDGLYTDAAKGA